MNIYVDGSGTNGETICYCVCDQNKRILKFELTVGNSTNNEMEYKAMIEALMIAKDGDTIFSDSQLIVYQISGKYRVREPRLKVLANQAKDLLKTKDVKIQWINREENLAGHFLEKNH